MIVPRAPRGVASPAVSIQVHVVGARPNFVKAAPVVSALAEAGVKPVLVHTGQHYDDAMSHVFFEQLGLPKPDINLGVGSGSHAQQTGAVMTALEDFVNTEHPELIVVYGDVNSTLAASLVAAKAGIRLAHVEAGLRSFDSSMPEEINRVVADSLSDLHFTTSPEAEENLLREGADPRSIHFVGNPMIDSLIKFQDSFDAQSAKAKYDLGGDYAVCTLHRPANVDHQDVARRLVEALSRVAKMVPMLLPLHPRGRASLENAGLLSVPGVIVRDPIGYLDFVTLISEASLVLTDSGGIQEETTFLGVPCLTLRSNTERPITVTSGTNRLVGNDPDVIARMAEFVLGHPPKGLVPPLWDGKAGLRIADVLIGAASKTGSRE